MRKFLISSLVIVGFTTYSFYIRSKGVPPQPIIATKTLPKVSAITPTQIPTSTPVPSSPAASSPQTSVSVQPTATPQPVVPTATPQPSSQYKDGTYTGSVADAYYGNIQVQATISGGKITSVQFLQHPNDNSYSIYVNQQADPVLAQEAIQAQSANVNAVSGASESSQAFVQSLSAALSQAKS